MSSETRPRRLSAHALTALRTGRLLETMSSNHATTWPPQITDPQRRLLRPRCPKRLRSSGTVAVPQSSGSVCSSTRYFGLKNSLG